MITFLALCQRALIDFPDYINLPETPVKIQSEHNIVIKNIGVVPAAFTIAAKAPYSVCPSKALLAPEEMMYFKTTFRYSVSGLHESFILVHYEDGVRLKIRVKCNTVNSNILLNNDTIRFDDTFIGLQRKEELVLENRSDHFCKFQWKLYKSTNIEMMRMEHFRDGFEQIRDFESLRYVKLKRMNVIDEEGHGSVYQRIYQDELKELEENEEFTFQNENFQIIPLVLSSLFFLILRLILNFISLSYQN